MMNRHSKPRRSGTPWAPAPEVPGAERAERLRLEMESQLWLLRPMR